MASFGYSTAKWGPLIPIQMGNLLNFDPAWQRMPNRMKFQLP